MKLLASDWDGTLRRNLDVDVRDLTAIKKFRSLNHVFGIVTGRSIGMLKNELAYYHVPYDFMIGTNGGVIANEQLEVIWRHDIEFDAAIKLIEYLKTKPTVMFGISDGDEFGNIHSPHDEGESTLIDIHPIDPQLIINRKQINSFYLRDETTEKTHELYDDLNELFGKDMKFHYNTGTIDVSAANVSKRTGILKLMELYNSKDIYVIGDGHNDIEMIEAFHGFAVEGAADEVKEKAVHCYHGLYDCIEDLLK